MRFSLCPARGPNPPASPATSTAGQLLLLKRKWAGGALGEVNLDTKSVCLPSSHAAQILQGPLRLACLLRRCSGCDCVIVEPVSVCCFRAGVMCILARRLQMCMDQPHWLPVTSLYLQRILQDNMKASGKVKPSAQVLESWGCVDVDAGQSYVEIPEC